MISNEGKIIAVDFDGTIVEHKYPKIGKEMLFAFDTLKALQAKGHKLILWTFRAGDTLQEAVDYCKQNGIEFYAINKSYPEEDYASNISRKINADIFIDDRNVGGFIGWSEVWQNLHPEGGEFNHQIKNKEAHYNSQPRTSSFFKRILGK
ncbi:MAG: hydrolase [Bacteroidetes bacterium]|nr:hydrolase [Bacteroidota bacterium]